MNYIDIVIRQILDNFDFAYMLCCNILLLGIVYYNVGEVKVTVLVNSAILAPVFWSWVAAPILRKFGVKYKQVDDALK